jgi:hypothetical protein
MQINALEILNNPEALEIREQLNRLGLEGYNLHPDSHMTLEILSMLDSATIAGKPKEWMEENFERKVPMDKSEYPERMIEIMDAIESEYPDEVRLNLGIMTRLANTGDVNNREDRRRYQEAEKYLMFFARSAIEERLGEIDPKKSLLWVALRGAEFFVEDFEDTTKAGIVRIEAKRIKLEDDEYAMGVSKPKGLEAVDAGIGRQKVEDIYIPDDCLSTGMSQKKMMDEIFENGFRPKRIIVPVTVTTTAGFRELERYAEELKLKYNHVFELIITFAGVCEVVDGDMYLRTVDGLYLVGDMGNWNKSIYADLIKDGAEQ